MTERNVSASKGRRWFEWVMAETVTLFAGLSPLALLGLILIVLVDGVMSLLRLFGVVNTKPVQNDAEIGVVLLAGFVVSLLLVILRALERIANTMEGILNKFDDLG
jgi:hypothetical protein